MHDRFGWRDGRRTLYVGLVGDATAHEAALSQIAGDRIAFEPVPHTVRECDALNERIGSDDSELSAAGFEILVLAPVPERGVVEVTLVGGHDAATAQTNAAPPLA